MDAPATTPTLPQRPRKKKMRTLKKVLIAVGACLLALIVGIFLLLNMFFKQSSSGLAIPATDYIMVTNNEVSNKVRVEGKVEPANVRSVTTALTTPITAVNVKSGDRVEQGQVIATIDTTAAEAELTSQQTQQDNAVAEAQTRLTTAQSTYDRYKAGIDNNTNAEISAALSAQRTAETQLTQANQDLATKREALRVAGEEEKTTLAAEVKAAETAASTASTTKTDADTAVNTARENANAQLATYSTEVGSAQTALTTAETTREQTLAKIRQDITSATITAPISGVVMTATKPGAVATGPIATIGDDTALTITTSVRESELTKVKVGNKVTFTSGASGTKEYTGTVTQVASVADSAVSADSATGAVSTDTSTAAKFTVKIEVTGDREGLYLGASVKAQIITSEEAATLSVPLDAVYTNDAGSQAVIVATPLENGNFKLEEKTVTTGLTNETSTALTGGEVKEGDMVISTAEMYRSMIGSEVTFDAGTSY